MQMTQQHASFMYSSSWKYWIFAEKRECVAVLCEVSRAEQDGTAASQLLRAMQIWRKELTEEPNLLEE